MVCEVRKSNFSTDAGVLCDVNNLIIAGNKTVRIYLQCFTAVE